MTMAISIAGTVGGGGSVTGPHRPAQLPGLGGESKNEGGDSPLGDIVKLSEEILVPAAKVAGSVAGSALKGLISSFAK
jgi:hypothetical protein